MTVSCTKTTMAPTDDARIGDFSKPLAPPPKPATATTAPTSPTKEKLESLEQQLESEASKDEAVLKPMVSFEEKLKAADLTREKAAAIIDAVMTKGYYTEPVKITSTLTALLRTRSARDIRRINEMLEAQRFTMDVHYNEAWSRLLLAASLEGFGKEKFAHPDPRKTAADVVEQAFQERVAYVDGLPDPALRILLKKLWKFDARVSVATEEGSIENF
jgi:hypothetical protein